ncbi:hypothetical protein FUAX_35690 [Fulvitalea axinellae]|uniref:EamA domain-containing protein n=1 Tax=Fulvitalea axinellae TaxID=1182444 RepID=A0AAU9D0E1_9BACT|nr:hypothetical protein FUAX_35690 [Fulvitalea axinellae]
MRKIFKAHAAVFSANFIYGVNFFIAKGIMPDYFSPEAAIFFRILVATLLFWAFFIWKGAELIDRKDILRFMVCGLCGVAVNQIMFFKGLNLSTPVNSAIIMTSSPVIVFAFAALLKQEKVSWSRMLGIVFGATGALLLITQKGNALAGLHAPNVWLGNLLMLGNASFFAVYLALVKPLMKKYDTMTVITWVFTFGCVFALPYTGQYLPDVDFPNIPLNIWLSLAFVIVFTTFLAYLLNTVGLQTLRASTVSFYIYAQPLVAGLVNVFLDVETFTLTMLFSFILVCSGVFLVGRKAPLPAKSPVDQPVETT